MGYCHWKSNSHLNEGLNGETDLDLLVDSKDKENFETALHLFNFKKVISAPQNRYFGIEDYLGFDYETGKLIHLHVHHLLILGQKFLKNHHLPLEATLFSNLQIKDGIKIPKPEFELFLLTIRSLMKIDIRDVFLYLTKFRNSLLPKDILEEYQMLIKQCSINRFETAIEFSALPVPAEKLSRFLQLVLREKLSLLFTLQLRRHIFISLRPYRNNNLKYIFIRLFSAYFQHLPVIKKLIPIKKKALRKQGRSFALVGADGSGKSSLTRDLLKWLSWKIDAKIFYFGIPKYLSLKILNRFISLLLLPKKLAAEKSFNTIVNTGINLSAIRWLWIAKKRNQLFHQVAKFTAGGGVALCDRYPMSAFWDMDEAMDGPRIRAEMYDDNTGKALKEESYYSKIGNPDQIFVLHTDIDQLRKRKSDLDSIIHTKKADAVLAVKDSDSISTINANQPYKDVLLEIKRKIWNMI